MIFDSLGLPRPTGACDFNDSAAIAGIMETFSHPTYINLSQYIVIDKYVRHPLESKYDFSRDQTLCLMAGLWSQKRFHCVDLGFVKGKDWFSPGHKGHVKRCKNEKANWFQDLWLKAEILFHAKITPLEEPNQMLCMAMVAGPEYVKLWTNNNKQWQRGIRDYFCGWRQEPELAELMIHKISNIDTDKESTWKKA